MDLNLPGIFWVCVRVQSAYLSRQAVESHVRLGKEKHVERRANQEKV
jgi:hypothetical protein